MPNRRGTKPFGRWSVAWPSDAARVANVNLGHTARSPVPRFAGTPGRIAYFAAAPLRPGWLLQTNYYHTSVSAGADVSRAREITIGRIPINLNANLSATLHAPPDLGWAMPLYTFATPVFGGQASVGVLGMYGRVSTSLAGTLAGTLTTPLGTVPFARSDSISDAVWGFGDVLPIATLRWNAGVHNYMTYITGDIPVGAYDSARLSNIGIGQGDGKDAHD